MDIGKLRRMGFDLAHRDADGYDIVQCSQCDAVIINGTPCHETGCPNITQECRGCNNMTPRGVKYCEDCR